jgi:hypothetical protein
MTVRGRDQRRVETVPGGEVLNRCLYLSVLGCAISSDDMNKDLEGYKAKYNKLNGCIKRNLERSVVIPVKRRLYDVVLNVDVDHGYYE